MLVFYIKTYFLGIYWFIFGICLECLLFLAYSVALLFPLMETLSTSEWNNKKRDFISVLHWTEWEGVWSEARRDGKIINWRECKHQKCSIPIPILWGLAIKAPLESAFYMTSHMWRSCDRRCMTQSTKSSLFKKPIITLPASKQSHVMKWILESKGISQICHKVHTI